MTGGTIEVEFYDEGIVDVEITDDVVEVEITEVGPAGPPGAAGDTYMHSQGAAAASWSISHGLGYYPSVTVVDSTGREVLGDVVYDDVDTVTVSFSAPFSGAAYLS